MNSFSKRIPYLLFFVFVIVFSFFLFSIPSTISDEGNRTNISWYDPPLEFNPISGFEINRSHLAKFNVTVYEDRVEYTFELIHNPNDFSPNFIFLPPRTGIETAPQLLAAFPSADGVSGFDRESGGTVGYLPIFGGIGTNFTIIPFTVYEVSVTKNEDWTFNMPL